MVAGITTEAGAAEFWANYHLGLACHPTEVATWILLFLASTGLLWGFILEPGWSEASVGSGRRAPFRGAAGPHIDQASQWQRRHSTLGQSAWFIPMTPCLLVAMRKFP